MKTIEKCKRCDFSGWMLLYVKPFKISCGDVHHKYGFHYGSECPKCHTWQKWITQTDELTNKKFYDDDSGQAELKLDK